MDGYRRDQADPRSAQLNQGVTEAALDRLMYRRSFSFRTLEGTTFGAALGPAAYAIFPAGAVTSGRMVFVPPWEFWISGTVTVRLFWTNDTASTNTVAWRINMTLVRAGEVPNSAGNTPGAQTTNVAGPSTANAEQEYEFPVGYVVDSSVRMIGLTIQRMGPDANAGEARLFALELIYRPAAGH